MTTKAQEERSRDRAVYETNWRQKFESWQAFIFLKIATDFLFPSFQYQLPSLSNIQALKAIIISLADKPYHNCCADEAVAAARLFRSGSSCWAEQQLGNGEQERGLPRGQPGDGNPPGPSSAGERNAKASQKPSLHPVCVGVCPPQSARPPGRGWAHGLQTPGDFVGQHLLVPDQGWERSSSWTAGKRRLIFNKNTYYNVFMNSGKETSTVWNS